MKILLCGASGFIGRHVRATLELRGHMIIGAGAQLGANNQLAVNYAKDVEASDWLPRLADVDAVVNAVGVLRDTAHRPMQAVHTDTPKALFDACSEAGRLRGKPLRVIHISALGIGSSAQDNPTRYASTKREADAYLMALHKEGKVAATVLRPSIVFGRGGASSQMFATLASLPVLVLPKPVLTARVQPIAVVDLVRGVAQLVESTHADLLYECVGTTELTLAEFIASLRAEQGRAPARIFTLPDWMARASARLGDYVAVAPWCTETLTLLMKDNTSSASNFAQLLSNQQLPLNHYWRQAWNSSNSCA